MSRGGGGGRPDAAPVGPAGRLRVVVHGAEGRMGRLVAELVEQAADCELVGLVGEPGRERPAGDFHPRLPLVGQDRLAGIAPAGAVIVDFSLPAALEGLLAGATAADSPLVIGTTGHDAAARERIARHAERLPVLLAANFSLGVPALRLALELLARALPPEFAAEQVETHHRHKRDRPSGTALWLAEGWREARGGETPPTHSLRLGGVVGEHAWTVCDDEETLFVGHRAHSRRAFLRGVLPAVRFVAARRQGLYGLPDVLREGLGTERGTSGGRRA